MGIRAYKMYFGDWHAGRCVVRFGGISVLCGLGWRWLGRMHRYHCIRICFSSECRFLGLGVSVGMWLYAWYENVLYGYRVLVRVVRRACLSC